MLINTPKSSKPFFIHSFVRSIVRSFIHSVSHSLIHLISSNGRISKSTVNSKDGDVPPGDTLYNAKHGEDLPERGTFFRLLYLRSWYFTTKGI